MASRLHCFFSHKHPKDTKIVQFTEEKFAKCLEILQIKKKYQLVYSDVILPAKLSGLEGYHSGCYRRFTALAQKYKNPSCNDAEPCASTSTDAPATDLSTSAE